MNTEVNILFLLFTWIVFFILGLMTYGYIMIRNGGLEDKIRNQLQKESENNKDKGGLHPHEIHIDIKAKLDDFSNKPESHLYVVRD